MILHGYWRSSAAYRARIGLNLKGLAYEQVTHDLRSGAQAAPDYVAKSPQGLVPALEVGDRVFVQSLAILEWLDETHPTPPFLPADPDDRAVVRAMALAVAADIHPVNNLRIVNALRSEFGADGHAVAAWMQRWMAAGFEALEVMVARHGGRFAFGDAVGLADILLVPQWYNAERYRLDTSSWPRLAAAVASARALPAFVEAEPERQPDAD
ncbi:maleylacetoacetate isomerase [Sphingomonas sp. DT-204]|uniref:maleylacetoacetate isomerase n=1 Tax=Sphingomonas sp. DT-204 TaxID=3396166 RepID=UPI003F1A2915